MKKRIILISLLLAVFAACFIPVTQQKTITVKSPFLDIFRLLTNAEKWEQWRPDLRKVPPVDSNKISVKKDTNSFKIKYDSLELNVKWVGNSVNINDHIDSKTFDYSYAVIPNKLSNNSSFISKTSSIILTTKISIINYLIEKFKQISFSDTHIADLKNFMETDSLYYGCN